MAVTSMIKDNAMGFLGNIEKAKLIFLPQPEGEGIVDQMGVMETDSLALAKGSLTRASNSLAQNLAYKQSMSVLDRLDKEGEVFDVQFNPSSIRMQAVGGGNAQVQTYGTEKNRRNGATFKKLDARVDISFNLIFDAVDRQDAFAQDKQNGVAQGAINVGKAIAGYEYTVLPQVEGLHASIRARKVALVTFQWGKNSFTGTITQLNTVYTMFSPVGNPIRAVASIRLTCLTEDIKQWVDSHDTLFSGSDPVITKSLGQTMKGLVNL